MGSKRACTLGVCYYPEQWPEERWAGDARAMAEFGIEFVRIAEFAWSRIEPQRDRFQWEWLDRAIDTLAGEGLGVVMCTPTATPPKWLVDERPEILPWDADGRPRRFGGRRHYCYSSPAYREETVRICEAVASRYGDHPGVVGWQTDNEHGNHATVLSYAPHCVPAFQGWLERRYGTIDRLNEAWGTVFWSQEYRSFADVEPPYRQVGRANMAHVLDYRRFSSDQVVAYDRLQAEILRRRSPGRWITHNFIGHFWDFDHFALSEHLDFPSVNNYPVLMTDRRPAFANDSRVRLARVGHPDCGPFNFDVTRAQGPNRWWIMEAMSGPADAGHQNANPAPGMVRLWTWEAFAHGAEVVSYFRWRQVHYAQEQWWHALHRPDGLLSRGGREARQVSEELDRLGPLPPPSPSRTALVIDYDAHWMIDVQPHSEWFNYPRVVQTFYGALRRLGLDVDILPPGADLSRYELVAVPTLPHVSDDALRAFEGCPGHLVFGPRSGSKTREYQIPLAMPPGPLQAHLPLKVVAVESTRPEIADAVEWRGNVYRSGLWRDYVETDLAPEARFGDGEGAVWHSGGWHYVAFHPDEAFLTAYFEALAGDKGLETVRLPELVRLRRRGPYTFAFNYGSEPVDLPASARDEFVLGGRVLQPRDVAVWKRLDQGGENEAALPPVAAQPAS